MSQIRVLHILHSMNRGGAENALMNYYRNIDRKQLQFDFLLTDSNPSQFENEIISLGGRVYRIPALRMTNLFQYVSALHSFFRTHPEYRIVHSHTSSKSFIPLAIAHQCGIPVRCSHSHSSSSEKGIKGWLRNLMMPLLRVVATDYLSCGKQAAEWLYGKKMVESGRVIVFNNVIEAELFRFNPSKREEIRSMLGVDDDVLVLGHTARFNEVKNHLFDIDILCELKQMGKKAKLLLVGGGELESHIKLVASQKGVLSEIIFVGIIPNVYDYEQAMDVFLLPSFYEGLPLSIIEAQVSGLPCFTSKDRVSTECSVTNLITYLPLESGPRLWADNILSRSCNNRRDRFFEIVKAGYDAKSSAKRLQEFYLNKYRDAIQS